MLLLNVSIYSACQNVILIVSLVISRQRSWVLRVLETSF